MRFSWKALIGGTAAVALLASSTALGSRSASAQPTPPTRFFGSVTGAAAGATVEARVGSNVCGTGTVTASGSALSYVVDVSSASTKPGCGTDGATVTFTVGGAAAGTGTFQTGAFVPLNLTVAARATATPAPARTAAPAPARTAAPAPARTAAPAPIRTPVALPATPVRQGAVAAPAQQKPAAAPAKPQAPRAAPALPRTGAAAQAESTAPAGLALFGIALAAMALGAGSLVVSRRSR